MKTQMEMYLEKLPEFSMRFNGKIIAVRNGEFPGEYPSKLAAWKEMQKRRLNDGEYVIVECQPNESDYSLFG